MKNILHLLFILFLFSSTSVAQGIASDDIKAFTAKTGAVATIDRATNSISFLRFPVTKELKLSGLTASEKAASFLKENGNLFAMKAEDDNYLTIDGKQDNFGMSHVSFQQLFKGVPVYDGMLKFHFNKNTDLSSINGNFISIKKLDVTPEITQQQAENAAIKIVTGQKMGNFTVPLKINKSTLYVFQKGLAQGYQGPLYLTYEVEVTNDADVREFLFIDAHTMQLVEQFTGIHSIDRKLYETSTSSGNLKWKESNGIPGTQFDALDVWQKSEVQSAGHIYNLMKNAFNYTSYNNADATMITVNNDPNISCPNANWNGVTANYCTGVAADDAVAHEWAHAYTQYTSKLVYAWQPGALNEAYSDIWGETVDQLNSYMDDNEVAGVRNGCATKARWLIGEQTTVFNGPLRDMWDPTCKGHPGKVSDNYYWCASSDNGGVHLNSGVVNHAYALLVDGGTYNGKTITGLGLTKAAHIFWRAQKNYMTSTTDFAAFADILVTSLNDLIGLPLQELSTGASLGVSTQVILAADALELAKVIDAVELRSEPNCNFQPILQPVAAICTGGTQAKAFFYETFESGLGNWTASTLTSPPLPGTWAARSWTIKSSAPGGRTGKVAFGVDYLGGNCADNMQNGVITLASPVITIPAGASGPFYLAFDHYVATESTIDGGNIRYRINGSGGWTLVQSSAFTSNAYNATLKTSGNNNPLAGQTAFTGTDGGKTTGSWGQSRIDLTSLGLDPGETIEFRWDMGTDGCGGVDGWYIDDVRVYSCAEPSVQFASGSTTVNEGEANAAGVAPNECLKYIEKVIVVKINKAPSQPVTVTFNSPTGSATQGITADYTFSPASFVLQSGNLSQNVTVRIYNDASVEGDETFTLSYTLSSPPGGDAFPETTNQTYTVTIVDDDLGPQYTKSLLSANFNTGMPVGWNVVGGGTYPSAWSVNEFDVFLDLAGHPMMIINSDAAGVVALDKVVESAPFNSVGMTNMSLTFIENYYPYLEPNGNYDEQATVDVWDGSAWHTLLTQSELTGHSGSWAAPASRNLSIPVAYANAAMKIRFRYIANYDYYWAIDNVVVTGTYSKSTQTAVSTNADVQYLGPNATVYFYDNTSGNIMAKIKNLSSHDYGCTAVQVDRAGVDDQAWVGSYRITKKTFKVTPANNNTSGNYDITLYYNASELQTFSGSAIKSIGKSAGSIATAVQAQSSFKNVSMSTLNPGNYAYTATFQTGFSGFGLSDATSGALPVTLIKFDGKHTAEGNVLEWATTSEVNNDYFAIERSLDAKTFSELSRVAPLQSAAFSKTYTFLDTKTPGGVSYYRLKQVDKDGTFAYSKMISIDAGKLKELRFFPNPVTSILNLELPDHMTEEVDLKIINVSGQIMVNKKRMKAKNGFLSYDLDRLPVGVYQIVLSDGKAGYNFSVVKQ